MQKMSRTGLKVGAVSLHSMLMWVLFASRFVATGARGLEMVLENIVALSDGYVEELLELVRIPSVSALPCHQQHIDRAASWVAKRLERAGIQNVQTLAVEGDPHPVVYGDFLHSPTAPTVLLYAHYDVQVFGRLLSPFRGHTPPSAILRAAGRPCGAVDDGSVQAGDTGGPALRPRCVRPHWHCVHSGAGHAMDARVMPRPCVCRCIRQQGWTAGGRAGG